MKSIDHKKTTLLEIVPYTEAHRDEVLSLVNLSLGEKQILKRDAAYWHWKHEENPFGRSLMLVGLQEGKVVGMRAFLRWQLNWQGERIEAAKPVDSVTHPQARRQGVFSQLTTAACDMAQQMGIQILFNTPNQNSLPGYLKLGWQQVGLVPSLVKVTSPATASWKLLKSLISSKHFKQEIPTSDWFISDPTDTSQLFGEGDKFEEAFENLLLKSNSLNKNSSEHILTDKTISFWRWRYMGHPHYQYYVERCYDGAELTGVLFYRLNVRRGLREVMITDIVTNPEKKNVVKKLIAQLSEQVRSDYFVSLATKSHETFNELRASRFRIVPRKGLQLVARSLVDQGDSEGFDFNNDIYQFDRWSLSLGDLEGL
ncbi:hypothetical protein MNBD_PLANCTO02-120 [hydrothermal vent metagenome]|uniref:N-acetyltransferase domain-containing protein n=1 Tax=hydrothermal vent metagenome TaxID=652676 RepID=A0A3B1DRP5_9ZZZZ